MCAPFIFSLSAVGVYETMMLLKGKVESAVGMVRGGLNDRGHARGRKRKK